MFPSRLRAGRLPRRSVLLNWRLGPPSARYIFADRPERWSPSPGSEQAKVRQLPGPRLQQDTERLVRQSGGSPKKPIGRDTQRGRTRADRRSGVSIAVLRAITSFSSGRTEGFAGEPRRKFSSLLARILAGLLPNGSVFSLQTATTRESTVKRPVPTVSGRRHAARAARRLRQRAGPRRPCTPSPPPPRTRPGEPPAWAGGHRGAPRQPRA
jgi:hypothetical protein